MYRYLVRISYIFFFVLVLSLFTLVDNIKAFSDDFTSDPRTNPNWVVQNDLGLGFDSPGITLTSNNSGSFPYLKTSTANNLETDKYYEIRFQYLYTGSPWGVGGSFTDNAPDYPTSLGTISDYLNYNIAYFWGDKLHSVTALCPKLETSCPFSWWFIYPNSSPSNSYYPGTLSDYFTHTFAMIRTDVDIGLYTYKIFLDNNLLFESKNTSRLVNSIWLGHPSNLGGSKNWPILKIYSVRSLPNPPSTFPYLSQKDPAWGSQEYDSSSAWAGIDKSGIDRWGCALTSAVMMLQNYKVKDLSGNEMKPDTLNTWLKAQPDGYIGPGLLNWLAVTRYVKQSYEAGKAETKLEFVRSYLPTTPVLPAILGLPGHFVVAYDEDSTNWEINDPANETHKSLAKTLTVNSVSRFVPSLTDLSYMMLVATPGNEPTLKDESGNPLTLHWDEEYLEDDVEGPSNPSVQVAMVPKPSSGSYQLSTDADTQIFLYDQAGEVKKLELPSASYSLEYDKTSSDNSSAAELDTTKPSFVSTSEFAGWYTTQPTAEFVYTDPNLRADYVNPSCEISGEGLGLTCSISPNVCDQSGNCNTDPQTSNPADIDKTPPSSSFTLPSITKNWDGAVEGVANDNLSGVSQVELIIKTPSGAESTVVASGTDNWTYTIPSLSEGEYVIKSRATDTAGNVESELTEQIIRLDTTPPEAPKILWADDWMQQIWMSWRKAQGANKYRVYLGPKKEDLTPASELSSTQWISETLKPGKYYVGVRAIDEAGNESLMSKIVKVEVKKKWKWWR